MKAAVLAKRQNWSCYYCNCTMSRSIGKYDRRATTATIDHKIPSSRGGSSRVENLVAACWRCNNAKGAMTDSEFIVRYGHDYSKLPNIEPDAKARLLRSQVRQGKKVKKTSTALTWGNKKLKKTPYKPLIPSVATLADCLPKIVLKDELDRKIDQAMANIEERILLAEWRLSFSKYEFSKWKKLRKKAQQKR